MATRACWLTVGALLCVLVASVVDDDASDLAALPVHNSAIPDACPASVLTYREAVQYGGATPSDGWFTSPQTTACLILHMHRTFRAETTFHVALALYRGLGAARDPGRALQMMTRTCLRGHTHSCVCAGHAYETGTGSGIDVHSAYSYYKRAANAGSARGAFGAALILYKHQVQLHDTDSEKTHDTIELLRAAIHGGILHAKFYLAAVLEYAVQLDDFYATQRRRQRPQYVDDFEEAAALYADACAAVRSCALECSLLNWAHKPVFPAHVQAVPGACYHRGLMQYYGRGIPQDFVAAFLSFQRELSIPNGSASSAAYYMAVLHGHGRAGGAMDARVMTYLLDMAVEAADATVAAHARMLRDDMMRHETGVSAASVSETAPSTHERRTASLLTALGYVQVEDDAELHLAPRSSGAHHPALD